MSPHGFFNLPQTSTIHGQKKNSYFSSPEKHSISTNRKTLDEQSLNKTSIFDVFAGKTPVIRQKQFLSPDECERMIGVLKTHEIGDYDLNHVWPRVGCVGIAQTDYVDDKETYLSSVKKASSLLDRWKNELGIDVVERISESLRQASGMVVRRAQEGDHEYFAGVIRAIDTGIQIHADYAPFEGAGWEIGNIAAQMSWNILLNPVPGGDTFIYDRQWQAPEDDLTWRKEFPKYAYDPRMVEGHVFKVVKPVPGDLYYFNPRNFHEVRACDISKDSIEQRVPTRFTVSSFVGFLPAHGDDPDTILLWS